MKILIFNLMVDADDPVLGFTTSWIQAIARHCEAVDVLTMYKGNVIVPSKVRVFSVGKEKGYSEARRVTEFYKILISLLTSNKYAACFSHMMPVFADMGFPLLRLMQIPIILWYAHKSVTWHLRLAEKLVDQIVTASRESFRLPSRKIKIIGHGIDTSIFIPNEETNISRPFTILTMGRIAPIKQIDLLIEAAGRLKARKDSVDFQVRIVGGTYEQDIVYEKKLRSQVLKQGLAEIIEFIGPLKHRDTIFEYQNADVMVNLSNTGSVDKAVLEAMSCGTPIITSNAAFHSILHNEEQSNWTIMDKDVEQLEEKIFQLMSMSHQSRLNLGKQLREIVIDKHDLQRLAKIILEESIKLRNRDEK